MSDAPQRFDRPTREEDGSVHRLTDRVYEVRETLAVVKTQLESLSGKVDGFGARVETLAANFATKTEVSDLSRRLDASDTRFEKFSGRVWTFVQFIVLAVLGAVLGLVLVKTGLPH